MIARIRIKKLFDKQTQCLQDNYFFDRIIFMAKELPQFPEFDPIDIGHNAAIRDITDQYPPYADFNAVNLLCWNIGGRVKVSNINGNLAFQLPNYIEDNNLVSMLGSNKVDESLHELLEITDRLELVPEVVVDHIEHPDDFKVEEDEAGHDYIYETAEIVGLDGRKYRKKRQGLKLAISSLGGVVDVATKTAIDEADKSEMRDLFIAWIQGHGNGSSVKDNVEFVAFNTLLDNADHLGRLAFTLIRDPGRLVGVSVNEVLSRDYALCHFEKVSRVYPHLGILTVNEAAKYIHSEGCELVNWEQDLGLPGLRYSKRSYHPNDLLKKYSITAAGK
jgi:uncharacterized protein